MKYGLIWVFFHARWAEPLHIHPQAAILPALIIHLSHSLSRQLWRGGGYFRSEAHKGLENQTLEGTGKTLRLLTLEEGGLSVG